MKKNTKMNEKMKELVYGITTTSNEKKYCNNHQHQYELKHEH